MKGRAITSTVATVSRMPSSSFPHLRCLRAKKRYRGTNTSIWGLQAMEAPNSSAAGTYRSRYSSSTDPSTRAVQKESAWPHWAEFKYTAGQNR